MDKNLRDRVKKTITDNIEEGQLTQPKLATALCSLIEERENEVIDDLVYAVKHTSFCKCDVCKVISQLKDQKGGEG